MKSIVCMEPNQFQMAEKEAPQAQQGEALVRIRRIGICGTDYHAFRGQQPFFAYPRVLGHELSGQIEEIGDNPYGLARGDQVSIMPYMACGGCAACRSGKTNCCTDLKVLGVHIDGGMQELLPVPAQYLLRTNGLSLDEAAILEPIAIGAHAVRRSGVQAGEVALVIGAGPIGLGVMAIAKRRGVKVIAMDVNEERLAFCREWANAAETINVMNEPMETLLKLTNGDLPPVVFDATGNAKSMMDAFRYVAHGGKLIYVGLVKADITFSDPDFHRKELTLLASRNATPEDFAVVVEAVTAGAVDASRYITHRAPFDAMIGEFGAWLNPASGVIKAVVEL